MSTDISLLLEYRDADRWQPAVHVADRVKDPRIHLGILEVCWWSVRSRPTSLFFGGHAVIPFHTGLPADLSPPIYEYVRANFEDDATYAAWISLLDLDLPSWHRRTVIVGGPVRARYAHLFGDGKQPSPVAELRQFGVANPVLERVTDWHNGRRLKACDSLSREVQQHPLDTFVNVTWAESLADFVGCIWDEGLSGLVDIKSPDRYRIVTSVG